jgi:hypothetical protein
MRSVAKTEETIVAKDYPDILLSFVALLEEYKRNCWLQQVEETAQTAKTTAFLQGLFGYRTVCHGLWPPRSPDSTPPDFFLFGLLKDRVYCNNSRNMEDRKPNTGQGGGTAKQTHAYHQEGGRHSQHLL